MASVRARRWLHRRSPQTSCSIRADACKAALLGSRANRDHRRRIKCPSCGRSCVATRYGQPHREQRGGRGGAIRGGGAHSGSQRKSGHMRDILFVDDDRDLLESLRARLYKHRHEWNMKFVVSGDEAIASLEQQPFDLVVSDVRMPGMDGGQLLTVVKQRWPNAMRIIVSGYSDPVQAVRLTSLAHQYVAKPCDGRELENIIERCFYLQELLGQESLRKVVGRIGKLPAMPKTYGLLQTALSQPSVTAAEIGDIVNADAAIASKVLQITNSAFFRLP